MRITIPADTFLRMANAAGSTERPHLDCVRLEHRNGKSYAVASTSHVMAIEYLGDTDQPDEFINVAWDDRMGSIANGLYDLNFEAWQAVFTATVTYNSKCSVIELKPDIEPLFTRWYDIPPANPSKVDKGFIYIQEELFRKLALSSPSGKLVFPEVVDHTRVMYVRDADDPNWLGLFLAKSNDATVKAATLPGWL